MYLKCYYPSQIFSPWLLWAGIWKTWFNNNSSATTNKINWWNRSLQFIWVWVIFLVFIYILNSRSNSIIVLYNLTIIHGKTCILAILNLLTKLVHVKAIMTANSFCENYFLSYLSLWTTTWHLGKKGVNFIILWIY